MTLIGLVDGRFRIEQRCASGGMGSVYRARDLSTGARVALKVNSDPSSQGRFDREAEVLARLEHPGIVRYVAHGASSGLSYLVMEWLDGETLRERLARTGLTARQSVAMTIHVCEALAAAHRHGVVHRDVKPSNLLFTGEDVDTVKLIDFGIVRVTGEAERLTASGASIGTPGYMAPEQVRSHREVESRADVFALGCVLYECLTGRRAFPGTDVKTVTLKIVLAQPAMVRAVRSDLPAALEEVVHAMLAKDAWDRPNAEDVARRLASIDRLPDTRAPRSNIEEAATMTTADKRSQNAAADKTPVAARRRNSVSLVIVAPIDDENGAVPDLTPFAALGERHGGRVETLADRSLLVTFAGTDGTETSISAATFALELRKSCDQALITLSSALDEGADESSIDLAIERGLRILDGALDALMAPDAGAGESVVYVDETAARLLRNRFEIESSLSGHHLLPPRSD